MNDNKTNPCTDADLKAAVDRYKENPCDLAACKFLYRVYVSHECYEKALRMKAWIEELEGGKAKREFIAGDKTRAAIVYTRGVLYVLGIVMGGVITNTLLENSKSVHVDNQPVCAVDTTPTRIYDEMDRLREEVEEKDKMLAFYGVHGGNDFEKVKLLLNVNESLKTKLATERFDNKRYKAIIERQNQQIEDFEVKVKILAIYEEAAKNGRRR